MQCKNNWAIMVIGKISKEHSFRIRPSAFIWEQLFFQVRVTLNWQVLNTFTSFQEKNWRRKWASSLGCESSSSTRTSAAPRTRSMIPRTSKRMKRRPLPIKQQKAGEVGKCQKDLQMRSILQVWCTGWELGSPDIQSVHCLYFATSPSPALGCYWL